MLTVNELIDRIDEFNGKPVEVMGLLTFEFEDTSLNHFPKSERRDVTEEADLPFYRSSVWLAFGGGSIRPNEQVLTQWHGKRVRVTGIAYRPHVGGCGHFGGRGCEIEPYSIERV